MPFTKQYFKHIISFTFGICILAAMIHYGDIDDFVDKISNMSKSLLLVSIFIYTISWIFRVLRLKSVTAHFKANINFKDLFKLNISGYALNVILPAKIGDIVRVFYLKSHSMKIEDSLASIIFIRILDLMATGLLAMSFIFIGFKIPIINKYASLLLGFCLLIFLGLIIFKKVISFSHILDVIENKITFKFTKGLIKIGKGVHVGLSGLFVTHRILIKCILISLFIWFFEILTCYFVALSLNIYVPIYFMIFGVALANIAKILPATPGGIGFYEGTIVIIFSAANVGYNDALSIAILDHFIKNLFIVILGVPITSMIGFDTAKTILDDLFNFETNAV